MPATKVNLSQLVDLAVLTPRVGAVNSNVLHTLLHAILRQLNIVDVQAETNLSDYDRDFLSASKARDLSVLSDIDSGAGDDAEDTPSPSLGLGIDSERSYSMPTPRLKTGKRTPHHQVASIQEELKNMTSVPSNKHLPKKPTSPFKGNPIAEMWLRTHLFRVQTNENGIDMCMSMIEDMTKEMQDVRDEHKIQMDQIKGLNIDDVMKRINAVEKSMADMRKKLDPGALDRLNVSSEILEQLQELEERVDALAAAREKMSDPIQDLLLRHEHEMHTLTITELQMKFAMLEDDLYQIQDMIEHDSTRWEIKHCTKYEEEIRNVLLQNEPDKTRNLACVVNDQLHIREDIITMEEDLKIKAIQFVEIPFVQAQSEPVEIPLELTKSAGFKDMKLFAYCDELQVDKADRTEVDVVTYRDELQVDKADRTEVDVVTYRDELQVDKADRTEVDVVTYRDELQVDKADRTEVDVVTYRDELQVDKADRTEVDVVTYRDELQVDKADRTEVDVAAYHDELQVDQADRTEVDVVTCCDKLQVDKADRTEVDVVTYRDELQVDKADRTEVDVVTYRDELQVDKADRTEVDVFTYHDELQVDKADRTEVDVAAYHDELQVDQADRTEVDVVTCCDELQVDQADRTEVDVKADKRTLDDKVNHSLFDTKTNNISRMMKKILNKMAVKDEAWNQQCKVFSDDIGRKLDRLELKSLKEWLLRRLKALNDQLNEQNQGHVRRLKALGDQLPTGDTSTRSGSNSLFDTETNDISKMIKEILNMIAVNEEVWDQQCKVFSDDIDRKLDRLEFKPLKEWLLRRLKALNDKLKKQNQGHVRRVKALNDKLKKQNQAHVRRVKALNDKLKKQNQAHVRRLKALNDKLPTGPVPSSMPRPDLTFEMDQILQHAKSDTSTCSRINRSPVHFAVTEKQKGKMRKSGQKVFKFISKMMLKPFRKEKSQ